MRRLVLITLAVFTLPVALPLADGAPVPKAAKKATDETLIVGAWEEPGGKQIWIFHADGTAAAGDPANPACKGLYKLDPTQTPKHLDWSQDDGKTWYLSVYELDGDALRISFGHSNTGVRPTAVDKANGFHFVSVTRRSTDK